MLTVVNADPAIRLKLVHFELSLTLTGGILSRQSHLRLASLAINHTHGKVYVTIHRGNKTILFKMFILNNTMSILDRDDIHIGGILEEKNCKNGSRQYIPQHIT